MKSKPGTPLIIIVSLLLLAPFGWAEEIVIGTWNIENFREHFSAHRLTTNRPSWLPKNDEAKALLDQIRLSNDEDNWEVSQVITDRNFSPDVLVIQEGCGQSDLEYFAKRWLRDAYATVVVFPTNTDRDQNLGLLMKPGFKIIERKDQYHKETDVVPNDRGNKLFARGPAFVLVESPGGYRFWVGTTHHKSKSGNNAEVTRWRNREAVRAHHIIKELEKTGPDDVMYLGDVNDELGIQQFEAEGGGDTVANILGPESAGLHLATRQLAESGQFSFWGYWRPDYRSFIDHVIVTKAMKDQIKEVKLFQNRFTPVASDHVPVMVRIQSDPVTASPTTKPAGVTRN
jgi:endonuclease/exonuclease/phosphatase family metal-dependent hydrolase